MPKGKIREFSATFDGKTTIIQSANIPSGGVWIAERLDDSVDVDWDYLANHYEAADERRREAFEHVVELWKNHPEELGIST